MTRIILTGICHNTLFGAGGLCCHSALIVVSKLGNGFLSNEYSLTYGAMITLCKTCLGTGGSYSRKCLLGMRKLADRLGVAIVTGAGEGPFPLSQRPGGEAAAQRGRPHTHFVCKKCGMIYDFEEEEQNFKSIKDQGFVIEKHRTVLYGECADCKNKKIKKFESV